MSKKQAREVDVKFKYPEYGRCSVPQKIADEGEDAVLEYILENVDYTAEEVVEMTWPPEQR